MDKLKAAATLIRVAAAFVTGSLRGDVYGVSAFTGELSLIFLYYGLARAT